MVLRPLPKELVARLERAAPKIDSRLGKMKNADHRASLTGANEFTTYLWGRRVRQMNVAKNYPGIRLVIKRVHGYPAEETIRRLHEKVDEHRKRLPGAEYALQKPHAYAIGHDLVAMAGTNAPSVEELYYRPSDRGQKAIARLLKRGFSEEGIRTAAHAAAEAMGTGYRNIVLAGSRRGKLVFVPLADLA